MKIFEHIANEKRTIFVQKKQISLLKQLNGDIQSVEESIHIIKNLCNLIDTLQGCKTNGVYIGGKNDCSKPLRELVKKHLKNKKRASFTKFLIKYGGMESPEISEFFKFYEIFNLMIEILDYMLDSYLNPNPNTVKFGNSIYKISPKKIITNYVLKKASKIFAFYEFRDDIMHSSNDKLRSESDSKSDPLIKKEVKKESNNGIIDLMALKEKTEKAITELVKSALSIGMGLFW